MKLGRIAAMTHPSMSRWLPVTNWTRGEAEAAVTASSLVGQHRAGLGVGPGRLLANQIGHP